VVEGPIGVGKRAWQAPGQSFASELILEQAEDNPFLERFIETGVTPHCRRSCSSCSSARQLEQIRQRGMFSPVRIKISCCRTGCSQS
jgi:hypothetical protein